MFPVGLFNIDDSVLNKELNQLKLLKSGLENRIKRMDNIIALEQLQLISEPLPSKESNKIN